MTYGFADNADVRGLNYRQETREDFSFEAGEQFAEVHFDLKTQKETMAANLPNLLGRAQVSAALAAAAVGLHFGLKLEDIVPRLATIEPQNGRMRPLPGIKGCLILDDSYNAAPASMRAALEVLGDFQPRVGARRLAVLGKMAELGPYEVDEHRLVGHQVAQIGTDLLITVTEPAKVIRQGAIEAGLASGATLHFNDAAEAGRYLDGEVRPGDIVLVKGSQSARLEKVVKDLLADPIKAPELLVRQEGKWLST
jgi:UDP-N-acetylmuramyl pentapeptide synthase